MLNQAVYKDIMQDIKSLIEQFIEKEALPATYVDVALLWYIPLCKSISLHHDKAQTKTIFIGINGCQGSGKSTLSGLLSYVLNGYFKKSSIVMSLDDFYLTKSERRNLANTFHPLLATRGVPGTHDTQIMHNVFSSLKSGVNVKIPTFNKATDDRNPIEGWQSIDKPIDIVIMEGWCWGTMPQTNDELAIAVNDLERNHDANSAWRTYVNKQLNDNYVPLYSFIDKWIFLRAPSFDHVYKWRCQQEQKLRARARINNTSNIMSDEQIHTFIQYYQRLTMHTLNTLGKTSDWIYELDNQRNIIQSHYNEN